MKTVTMASAAMASAAMLVAAGPAFAADPSMTAVAGVAGLYDSTYAYAAAAAAVNGNIDADGFLVRLGGGIGQYSYETRPGVRQGVGQQQADAMMGYHEVLGVTHLTVYAGLEMQNHENSDPTATVRGARIGAKGQVELYSPLGGQFYTFAMGSFSSAYDSFYTQAKVGYHVTDRWSFGPEGSINGNDRYDHASTGGFISYDFGGPQLSVSGGYQWDLRAVAPGIRNSDGPYGTAGVVMRF
jgi:Cellulose biosynthesis protein BcsS